MTDIELGLRKIWGNEIIDGYLKWSYYYSEKEADFLQLRHTCPDDESYYLACANLSRLRRKTHLENLTEWTLKLNSELGIPFKQIPYRTKLFFRYDKFEALIHERYYPTEDVNEAENLLF